MNEGLERQLTDLRLELKTLDSQLRAKETEYTFLLQEYKDVNEQRLQQQQKHDSNDKEQSQHQ
jgi:uncharacterized protein (DUF3084 family)